MSLRRLATNLGWEGIFFGTVGIIAFLYGLLDFLPFLNLTDDPVLRLILSVTGLILTSVAAQMSKRSDEIRVLRDALGEAEIELLDMKVAFPQHIANSASKAQKFILDTNLNSDTPRLRISSPQEAYRQIRDRKLRNNTISFRRVVLVFHRYHLESVIESLLTYEGKDYYVRHYNPPPTAIPIIHMMSFDDEQLYLGGFYPTEGSSEEHSIYIRHSKVAALLKDYWEILWQQAIPLNRGRMIDWNELRKIGRRIGLSDTEFDDMVAQIKERVGISAATLQNEHR